VLNMTDTLMSVRNLKCRYTLDSKMVRAVDDVSFDVKAAEILGIVGESGSGKTTLALSLLGLLDSARGTVQGTVTFKGKLLDMREKNAWDGLRGTQIGMVFQSPEASFNPTATIGQQMAEALQVHRGMDRKSSAAAAKNALSRVGMPRPAEILECYPFELSGGMCQRAALALALSLQPALLLADEPTSSLDLLSQAEIMALLSVFRHQHGMAMIVISHDLGLIARLSDRVAIMYAGRIIECGPTSQVLGSPQHPYTQGLLASLPRLEPHPRDIQALSGHAPDMASISEGCTFLPRCSRSGERCTQEQPQLALVENDSYASCWMPNSSAARK
jgi:oligopeptide/dipeptide ABC transporter ATP-binding protein